MSLLIGLQAPVLGFCQHSQSFFFSTSECEAPEAEEHLVDCHDCHHEHEQDALDPCDDCHRFLSLNVDDFTWASSESAPDLRFPTAPVSATPASLLQEKKVTLLSFSSRAPPPGVPLFRLHSVWRL
jgi:hypothetical protein